MSKELGALPAVGWGRLFYRDDISVGVAPIYDNSDEGSLHTCESSGLLRGEGLRLKVGLQSSAEFLESFRKALHYLLYLKSYSIPSGIPYRVLYEFSPWAPCGYEVAAPFNGLSGVLVFDPRHLVYGFSLNLGQIYLRRK